MFQEVSLISRQKFINREPQAMNRTEGYIIVACICLFYWVLDSIWSFISFETNLKKMIFSEPGSYLDTFLLNVSPYQIVSRLMVITLFFILGALTIEFIRKRDKAEKDRQQAHDSLLTVLNSIDATVYVSDMQSNVILFMNQFMIDAFGGDYSGNICHEVFHHRKEKCPSCINKRIVNDTGQPTDAVIWEGQNPVTKAWYIYHDRAIKWIDGRLVHLQVATDITHMKELQEIQAKAELQERQTQKMEAIGNLAGGIAHDFNNILTSILGFTELSLFKIDKGTEEAANMEEVLKAGKRAKELVRQILTFARRSEDGHHPLRIDHVVEEAVSFLRSSIPSSIDIQTAIESKSFVNGNVTQVHQVIMNLCTNAAHAMEVKGGLLEVGVKDINISGYQRGLSRPLSPEKWVEITIADSGQGIPEEIVDSIFEPYFTTKEIGEGTGLGLALVHGIVESYGGKIEVKSASGRGTTFTILLPVVKSDQETSTREQEQLPHGTERVLIVDDEPPIAIMLSQSLQQLGYSTALRTSSSEALELFSGDSQKFDLIVTDMTMPQMTGDIMAQKMKEIRADIPVILCTGYSKHVDAAKARHLGMNGYLEKPVDHASLARSVREALDTAA